MREVEDVQQLWAQYQRDADPALREILILRYMPLVRFVAARVGHGLPPNVELSDLVSYGTFGLIDAIDKYDPSRPNKFETYAIQRIRGAVIDELRALDWVPRSLRSRARDVERATHELEAKLKRSPSDVELADHLGMELGDLRQINGRVDQSHLVALDEVYLGPEDGGLTFAETLEDKRTNDPVAQIEDGRTRAGMAAAVAQLEERDKTIVTLYYYENLTLAEIGEIFGVTESRICQIHTKAILRVRELLGTTL